MPLVPFALTTLQRLKDYTGISGTASDTILEQLINRATGFIEARTNRRFKSTTFTNELYDGGHDRIFLRQYPVTDLATVEFRVGSISSPTFTAFNANDFLLYDKAGYIQFIFARAKGVSPVFVSSSQFIPDGATPQGVQNIRVTYTAGFLIDFANEDDEALHNLPFDLEELCIRIAAKRFNLRKADGVVSESVEGASITWANPTADQLSFEDKAILKKYEKKTVASVV